MKLIKNRSELVIYVDVGLIGSFVRFVRHATDTEKVFLEYKPTNSLRTERYGVAINKSDIKSVNIPQSSVEGNGGVEEKIIFIHTNEPGSVLNVLNDELVKDNKKLRDEIDTLKSLNSNLESEVEEYRSGVAKSVAGMRRVVSNKREDSNEDNISPFRRFNFD
jgi:hypothetical protein